MNTNNRYSDQSDNKIEFINPNAVTREHQVSKDLALKVLSECQTFFNRFLPNEVQREADQWRKKIIAQEGQQVIDISGMIHEFKIKAFRETANEALAHGSMAARKTFSEAYTAHLSELFKSTDNAISELTTFYSEAVRDAAMIEDDFARDMKLKMSKEMFAAAINSIWLPFEQFKNIPKNLIG